jgi:hypothetical protein
MRDVISGGAIAVLGALALIWLIPAGVSAPRNLPNIALSPVLWPQIIAVFLLASGLVLAVQAWRRQRAASPSVSKEKRTTDRRRVLTAIALLLPYYLACQWFGLLVPSIVAFGVYTLLAGDRNPALTAVFAVVLPGALTLFFIHVAGILIPLGPLAGLF